MNPYWFSNVTELLPSLLKLFLLPASALLIVCIFHPRISALFPRLLALALFTLCCLNTWNLTHPSIITEKPYTFFELYKFSSLLWGSALLLLFTPRLLLHLLRHHHLLRHNMLY